MRSATRWRRHPLMVASPEMLPPLPKCRGNYDEVWSWHVLHGEPGPLPWKQFPAECCELLPPVLLLHANRTFSPGSLRSSTTSLGATHFFIVDLSNEWVAAQAALECSIPRFSRFGAASCAETQGVCTIEGERASCTQAQSIGPQRLADLPSESRTYR